MRSPRYRANRLGEHEVRHYGELIMEATREIYWNVGHGVVVPMYILAFAAFGILAWGFWQRLPVWRQ
ncbi:MAG: hypothetical protein GJV46_12900, partial [Geobacter sp.]|nr:hypothetical protein [Geobacter sp.]